ncbi:MAG: hypothetical protein B6241_06040 [Spirochaetaceae bacterium 4572_59]|nr:MAG: hypothetical protein B6241_06040 [Spirochaetaceae bacterium 4572_59]
MENDKAKAQQFLSRLMQNPTMKGFSALQREDQLLQFFSINGEKLKPTLSSPAFFGGWSWQDINKIMIETLYDMTNKEILPQIQSEIFDKTSYSYISFMKLPAPSESMKRQFMAVLTKLLTHPVGRKQLAGPLMAIQTGIIKKYIMHSFQRQKYVHFELAKVQRLRMSQEEVYHLIKTSLMLTPLTSLFMPGDGGQTLTPAYAEKISQQLSKLIPGLPDPVIRSGINSSISFQDDKKLEATARLTTVFAHRCADMKQGMKIDRGAASSDQSWFNIARRNYKYYGYDFDMLTELYNISAENGW